MPGEINIELLADHPDAIPLLCECFERQWRPYYGPGGPGNALRDLQSACRRDNLPIGMIAVDHDNIYGTAALKAESISSHKHLRPWLAALLVLPEFRRQGIGQRLVAAIERKAGQLGYPVIYVGTGKGSGTPESLLRKRGWVFMAKSPYDVATVSIFKKALSKHMG